jgi:hypothetical protein
MPSPKGTNREQLFLWRSFACGPAAAYDKARRERPGAKRGARAEVPGFPVSK